MNDGSNGGVSKQAGAVCSSSPEVFRSCPCAENLVASCSALFRTCDAARDGTLFTVRYPHRVCDYFHERREADCRVIILNVTGARSFGAARLEHDVNPPKVEHRRAVSSARPRLHVAGRIPAAAIATWSRCEVSGDGLWGDLLSSTHRSHCEIVQVSAVTRSRYCCSKELCCGKHDRSRDLQTDIVSPYLARDQRAARSVDDAHCDASFKKILFQGSVGRHVKVIS